MNKEMKKLLLNAEDTLEEIIKRLEYDRQLYENFSERIWLNDQSNSMERGTARG